MCAVRSCTTCVSVRANRHVSKRNCRPARPPLPLSNSVSRLKKASVRVPFSFPETFLVKLHLDPQRLPVDAIAGEPALPPERLGADWLRLRLAHPPAWEPELPLDLRERFPKL